MVSRLWPRRSAVTFDVGAAGVRACQFRRRGNSPRLCDALQFDRAPSANDDQPAAPMADPAQIARLVGQGRFVGRDVTLVLSPPEVQFYPLRLPEQALKQPRPRVEQALKWEVARESRGSADSLEVRYWRLPDCRAQQANIMAVAMPSEAAQQWSVALQRQGLSLRRIDVSPCALVRLAQGLWRPADNEVWGVLDLGLRHTTLTVVVGAVPNYIRSLSTTAHKWTQQLAEAFEVPASVAEQLKREHGVKPTSRGLANPAPGRSLLHADDLPTALSSVLRDALHGLAREIERCFSYVMQSHPDHGVRGLVLSGGGARLGGLPEVLEADLGIPVVRLATNTGPDSPPWEQPLPSLHFEAHVATSFGGAILDLEAS